MKKTAILYARVSTSRQAEEELPIQSQIEQCRAKAQSLEAVVIREFIDDGKSGRTDRRSAFQDSIMFCLEYAPDYMITWSTSRFARNRIDAGLYKRQLERAGTTLVYVSQQINRATDDGWMLEGFLELVDEYYSRQVAADTKRSMLKNAREGYWNGGLVPFGYEAVPDLQNPKRKRLQPRPSEAAIVRQMFDMRIAGHGGTVIAQVLNSAGALFRGRPWQKGSVLRLLANEALIGRTVFNRLDHSTGRLRPREDWVVVQSHEPIVALDKWKAVQQLVGGAGERCGGSAKSRFVFTGLLRCGHCGAGMQTESGKGRSHRYYYYNCRTAKMRNGCLSHRLPAGQMDAWLIEMILDRILTDQNLRDIALELKRACGTWAREQQQRRQEILTELVAIEGKLDKLYGILETYGKDTPNLGDLTRRLRGYNARQKELEGQLAAIDVEQPPVMKASDEDIEGLAGMIRVLICESEDPKRLREFFGSFIGAIQVFDDEVRVIYDPDRIIPSKRDGTTGRFPVMDRWLPDRAILGTRTLTILLPERLRRRVA